MKSFIAICDSSDNEPLEMNIARFDWEGPFLRHGKGDYRLHNPSIEQRQIEPKRDTGLYYYTYCHELYETPAPMYFGVVGVGGESSARTFATRMDEHWEDQGHALLYQSGVVFWFGILNDHYYSEGNRQEVLDLLKDAERLTIYLLTIAGKVTYAIRQPLLRC
jgi:hypothetical protein